MIDAKTGNILCHDGSVIPKGVSLEDFVAIPGGSQCKEMREKYPVLCHFGQPLKFGGNVFDAWFYFIDRKLAKVKIALVDSRLTWSNWSAEAEDKLKAFHEDILSQIFGRSASIYAFTWGVVSTSYDPRVGSSSIAVTYN